MSATSGLSGKGLQQSPEQWAARSEVLATTLAQLIRRYRSPSAQTGLDVGCQAGGLIDSLAELTGLSWQGIDPGITQEQHSPGGARLIHGFADQLDFADESFDVLLFANVYEHVLPDRRAASLREMARVLRPGGVIVGQIPNPYFLIESHSRLPFMGVLPIKAQKRYWRLSNVPWEHNFFSVTLRHLRADTAAAGLRERHAANFNYPVDVYPTSVQRAVKVLGPLMKRFPWAWQFVFVKPT